MFLDKRLQKHRYLQCFYNIAMIFFSKPNLQKHRKLQCFAPCREGKKGLKTVPKPSKFDSFPAPWFLVEFVPIFAVFFPFSYVPKKRQIPNQFQDFHRFSQNPIFGSLKLQKRLEMQARTSFFSSQMQKTL